MTKSTRKSVPLPYFADILYHEYMKPFHVTRSQLIAAFPKHGKVFVDFLFSPDTARIVVPEIAAQLDAILHMPPGHFARVWCACAYRQTDRRLRKKIAKIKPLVGANVPRPKLSRARIKRAAEYGNFL